MTDNAETKKNETLLLALKRELEKKQSQGNRDQKMEDPKEASIQRTSSIKPKAEKAEEFITFDLTKQIVGSPMVVRTTNDPMKNTLESI